MANKVPASDAGHGLGPVVARYHGVTPVQRLLGGLGLLGLGGAMLACLSLGIELAAPARMFILSMVVGFAGLVVMASAFLLVTRRLVLCEDGFLDVTGRAARAHPWADVTGVEMTETEHAGGRGGPTYTYTFAVGLRDGGVVVLDDQIRDVEELGREVMRQVDRFRLKALLAAAVGHEGRGERREAAECYEEIVRRSPYNQIGEQAKERLGRLRGPQPAEGGCHDTTPADPSPR